MAIPHWRRLLLVCVRAAASRTFCTAGTNSAIRIAMIAITTSSSMRVKPSRFKLTLRNMGATFREKEQKEKERAETLRHSTDPDQELEDNGNIFDSGTNSTRNEVM